MADFDWGALAGAAVGGLASVYVNKQNQKAVQQAQNAQQEAVAANSRRISDLMTATPQSLPGAEYARKAGEEGVMRALRARGASQSGEAQKALVAYNNNLGEQNYQQHWARGLRGVQGLNTQATASGGYGADAAYTSANSNTSMLGGLSKLATDPKVQKSIGDLWTKYDPKVQKSIGDLWTKYGPKNSVTPKASGPNWNGQAAGAPDGPDNDWLDESYKQNTPTGGNW